MDDIVSIIVIMATFLLAGGVKGVIGLGLPTVSLGLLVLTFDLTSAMVLLIVPSITTNVWQALAGGKAGIIIKRIWPFLGTATGTIWLGAIALTTVNPAYLSILLGVLLVIYSVINFLGFRVTIASKNEKWLGAVFGVINGILTGMTGSFVVPGVMYLQAIGLSRDLLVQAMGMLFTLSTLGFAFALGNNKLFSAELAVYSGLAVLPAILGMVIGQRIRHLLPESKFRKVFFVSILILGVFIICKSILVNILH